MQPNDDDRASTAVRVWMPIAAVAAAITFVIAFVMPIRYYYTKSSSNKSSNCFTSNSNFLSTNYLELAFNPVCKLHYNYCWNKAHCNPSNRFVDLHDGDK